MTFKEAVKQTRRLEKAWKSGLRALGQDSRHVAAQNSHLLRGSADVDKALEREEPHEHRWDFAIGYQHSNRRSEYIYWVEVHSANDKEVKVVLDKLLWLKGWLKRDGRKLNQFERDFVWVSSGATSFTLTSPQQKEFALLGLQHKGRVLRILDERPS